MLRAGAAAGFEPVDIEWSKQHDGQTYEIRSAENMSVDQYWVLIHTSQYAGDAYKPTQDLIVNIINEHEINVQPGGCLVQLGKKGEQQFSGYGKSKSLSILNQGTIRLNQAAFFSEGKEFNSIKFENSGQVSAQLTENQRLLHLVTAGSADFVNSGSMTAGNDSAGGLNYLVDIKGTGSKSKDASISNSGSIDVSGNYLAVFRFEATQGKVNASFSNTGTLNVPDGVAFLDITDGVTATLQTVRLPVRTGLFTAIYGIGGYGQFAVNDGSRFIFTPEEDTKSGTILRLASTDRTPAVFYIHSKEGLTGNLRAEQFTTTDPEVWTVTLLGDGEDPTATDLQFDYIAKQDAGQSMAIYASRLSRDRGFRISELIEPLRVEQTYNAFVRPYHSESDLRFADDASIAASGIVFGATARLSPVLEHGPHFIAERAGYDAWDNRQDADSDAFGFGWHVLWRPINVLYVKAYATGMYASTDLDYQTELDRAADDFNDWSFFADLRVGHEFSAGSLGLLTPELGLSWAYNKTDDFKLTFGSGEVRRYESADQSDVFATAKLKWSGVFESADSYVRPELSFGIRTLLTDPEIDSVSHAGGQRHASSIDDDRCVGTVSAGLFVGNDDWTIALHGLGAFGANSSYRAVAATIGYHW